MTDGAGAAGRRSAAAPDHSRGCQHLRGLPFDSSGSSWCNGAATGLGVSGSGVGGVSGRGDCCGGVGTEAAAAQESAGGPEGTLAKLALAVCALRAVAVPAGQREAGGDAATGRRGESPSRAGAAAQLPCSAAAAPSAASTRTAAAGDDGGGASFDFRPPGSGPAAMPTALLSPAAGGSPRHWGVRLRAHPAPSSAAAGAAAP